MVVSSGLSKSIRNRSKQGDLRLDSSPRGIAVEKLSICSELSFCSGKSVASYRDDVDDLVDFQKTSKA